MGIGVPWYHLRPATKTCAEEQPRRSASVTRVRHDAVSWAAIGSLRRCVVLSSSAGRGRKTAVNNMYSLRCMPSPGGFVCPERACESHQILLKIWYRSCPAVLLHNTPPLPYSTYTPHHAQCYTLPSERCQQGETQASNNTR